MPTFQGQVSDEQLNALVAYVKSLAAPQPSRPANGMAIATPQP
jgi:mono/diheme cytochrome c family protein